MTDCEKVTEAVMQEFDEIERLTKLANLEFNELAVTLRTQLFQAKPMSRQHTAFLLDEVMSGECPEDTHLPEKEEVLQLLRVPVGVDFLENNFGGGDYESIAMPSVHWCEGCLQFAVNSLEK